MTAAKRRKQALRKSIKKLQEQVRYLSQKCDDLVHELRNAANAFRDARMGREMAEARYRGVLDTFTKLKMAEPPQPIVIPKDELERWEAMQAGQPAKKGEE